MLDVGTKRFNISNCGRWALNACLRQAEMNRQLCKMHVNLAQAILPEHPTVAIAM